MSAWRCASPVGGLWYGNGGIETWGMGEWKSSTRIGKWGNGRMNSCGMELVHLNTKPTMESFIILHPVNGGMSV